MFQALMFRNGYVCQYPLRADVQTMILSRLGVRQVPAVMSAAPGADRSTPPCTTGDALVRISSSGDGGRQENNPGNGSLSCSALTTVRRGDMPHSVVSRWEMIQNLSRRKDHCKIVLKAAYLGPSLVLKE